VVPGPGPDPLSFFVVKLTAWPYKVEFGKGTKPIGDKMIKIQKHLKAIHDSIQVGVK
jgi:hypothetical protein